jgi:ubiquinone/menaquinone biosynthesis C-methylase UbiE
VATDYDDLHSAAYFGAQRDFWWNGDFLRLMAERLELVGVRHVLDVGAGLGHWGHSLAAVLSPDTTVVGIERERAWVEEARRRAASDRFRYEEGVAEALPFEDASFDLVTCQTVLIHVADPRAVIREMLRVTKPGGLVLAVEPNNRMAMLLGTSVNAGATIDQLVGLVRFGLTCERGKKALGEGDSSVGDLVPGLLAQEGAVAVEVFLSDKPSVLVPPYESEDQQALSSHYLEEAARGGFGWSREEARRYFVAGGGAESEFEREWECRTSESAEAAEAVADGTFHTAGGSLMYLVSGRRPG